MSRPQKEIESLTPVTPAGVRLQKVLAAAGIGSRRHCEDYIREGRVSVDGKIVSTLGVRVDPARQEIRLDGEIVRQERKRYYVLNKPPGYVCTNYDPAGRPRAIDLVPSDEARLFTVGRLDENSSGLIVVTNDGELANQLAHPRYKVRRTYRVQVVGHPKADTLAGLREGMYFAEGRFRAQSVRRTGSQGKSTFLEIVMTEGQNREIRRMLARLGHKVIRLERVGFGSLWLGRLREGEFRHLKPDEIDRLRGLTGGREEAGSGALPAVSSIGASAWQEALPGRRQTAPMIERVPFAPLAGMNAKAVQQLATVVEQERMARDTYRIRLRCPELAQQIVPGQFFMVRAAGESETILGRPFALYDVFEENGRVAGVDFGYVIVGKLTSQMPGWQPGDRAVVWGPLGNGFPVPEGDRLLMVAGGIGQTPFLAVAREALGLRKYGQPPRLLSRPPKEVTLCYGARSAEWLAGLNDFTLPGLDVRVSTDDGTFGHQGFVTELLAGELTPDGPDRVYCCGPEPMMHAVARLCAAANIPCWLSLESPMACGFGACFSCVTRVRTEGDNWDYRRTCVEGPVFEADKLAL